MSKKSNTIIFISKALKIHGNKYNYSLVNYKTAILKVKIICHIHGEFNQTPNKHLCGRGCKMCANDKLAYERTKDIDLVLKQFDKIHFFKYNYSLVEYKSTHIKVNIICKTHGNFLQTPAKHLFGYGCPKCGFKSISKKSSENSTGWSLINWINASKKSKNFDSFKVYIIKCWNDDEEFYKIGRTFTSIKNRFKAKTELPYQYETIKIYEDTAKIIYEMEKELKNKNKEYLYLPKLKFNGMYECFRKII